MTVFDGDKFSDEEGVISKHYPQLVENQNCPSKEKKKACQRIVWLCLSSSSSGTKGERELGLHELAHRW